MTETGGKKTASVKRLSVDVQRRLDQYLTRVDGTLARRGLAAMERRAAALHVRTHIVELLSARSNGEPRAADLEAVLTEIGPPESVIAMVPLPAPHPTVAKVPPKLSLTAVFGAVWSPLFFILAALSAMGVELQPSQDATGWQTALAYLLLPLAWSAPLATTVLGLLALGRIQRSHGTQYGLSLALFDALLFPLLLLDLFVFWLCWQGSYALIRQDVVTPMVANVIFRQIVPTVVCVLGDYFLATRAWQIVLKPLQRGK